MSVAVGICVCDVGNLCISVVVGISVWVWL
jgi:hypothetical protein